MRRGTCRCGGHHRNRTLDAGGAWQVQARVERLAEPALLLALGEGAAHGYELADRLMEIAGLDVDYGNLYRLLRGLEEDGIVVSQWEDDANTRSRRTYELTPTGRELLASWIGSLNEMNERIAAFLRRYEEGVAR